MAFAPHPPTGDLESGLGRWLCDNQMETTTAHAHAGEHSLRIYTDTGGDVTLEAFTPDWDEPGPLPVVGGVTSVVVDGWAYADAAVFANGHFRMGWTTREADGSVGTSETSPFYPVVLGSWAHLVVPPVLLTAADITFKIQVFAYVEDGSVTAPGDDVFWDDFGYAYGSGWVVG